ncbi:hypothetical protein I203_104193 [Kwoniella mangroviensis CBS 8507]|uniref:uncharacterized protein n=1 Tax=Kwoniella mangroviensis CBS 8507 TaxID=1296122 RepID=UPI00080D23B9|nr:uncharacterized protein I203_00860 [Kwoniella mangroviensis CBS 8507]OCF70724.1 hypothetical protein I203_00860 [Kwoniella mangroviensis CBS 8507]
MPPVHPPPHPLDPPEEEMARRRAAISRRIQFHREMARLHPPAEPPINLDDFKDFMRGLGVFIAAPIVIPMRLIHHAITSPLTISVILKLLLLGFLLVASSIFSVLAVGAFFWSWKIGGNIEVEGWLFYGSKAHRPPHTTVYFPLEKIEQDLRYDVQVELELVRPTKGTTDEMGNFMLSLELRALDQPDRTLVTAAQPSLPPPPISSTFLSIPTLPTSYIPCILPYPFRSFCPSRLLGYSVPTRKIRERRAKGGFSSRERGKDVVPLKKDLMEGVILKPGKNTEMVIGSGFVSIGREDLFDERQDGDEKCKPPSREVKTTGWVLIRLIPRPTGIRWILSSHPLPPLLLLPPLSLSLTFSSSILAFTIITFLRHGSSNNKGKKDKYNKTLTDGSGDAKGPFDAKDKDERREGERRKKEWEEIQSSLGGGMEIKKGSSAGRGTTVGGSETAFASSSSSSFGPTLMTRTISTSSTSPSTSDSAETVTPTRLRDRGQGVVGSGGSSGSSGSERNLRRRGSGSRRGSATGTGIALSAGGSGTERAGNGNQAEVEDEGEETEMDVGRERRSRRGDEDWREFGREFGLHT